MIHTKPHQYRKQKIKHLQKLNQNFNWYINLDRPDYLMEIKSHQDLMQMLNDTIMFYCQSYTGTNYTNNVPLTTNLKLWNMKHHFRKYCNHLKVNHNALLVLTDPSKSHLLFDHDLFAIAIDDILRNMTSNHAVIDDPKYVSYKYQPSTSSRSDDFIMLNYLILYIIKTGSPLIKLHQHGANLDQNMQQLPACRLINLNLLDSISNLQTDMQHTLLKMFPSSPYENINQQARKTINQKDLAHHILTEQTFINNRWLQKIINQHNELLRKE